MVKKLALMVMVMAMLACNSDRQPKPKEGEIKINLIADRDINPNERGKPAPLNLFIYDVKGVDAFENSDFFEITEGRSKQVKDASSKLYEAILQPGESRTVILKPGSNSKALGILGAYRDIKDSVWMTLWTVPEKKKKRWWNIFGANPVELDVHFEKSAITIKKMD